MGRSRLGSGAGVFMIPGLIGFVLGILFTCTAAVLIVILGAPNEW